MILCNCDIWEVLHLVLQCNVYLETNIQTLLPTTKYEPYVDIYGLYVDYILTIYKFYFDKIIKSILYCKNMANSLDFLCNGIETIFIEILNELGHTPHL